MEDKDFKEQNNYREVECCGNCKHSYFTKFYDNSIGIECNIEWEGYFYNIKTYGYCDKWEHK